MSQYYCFYCIFDQTNAALVSMRENHTDPKNLNGQLLLADFTTFAKIMQIFFTSTETAQ